MPRKKWLDNKRDDFLKTERASQVVISWSSSSDEESTPQNLHLSNTKRKPTEWITNQTKIKRTEETSTVGTITSEIANYRDSPIIGSLNPELSPIISQKNEDISELSPVLGERNIYKKRYRIKKRLVNTENDSTDSTSTQEQILNNESQTLGISQIIIESQNSIIKDEPDMISQTCTPSEQVNYPIEELDSQQVAPCDINPFPSQDRTEISKEHESPENNFTVEQTTTRKRKRYKPGGLAHQLQKTLQEHETKLAIWQHEIYLSEKNNTQYITPLDEEEMLELSVLEIEKEFDNMLVECSTSSYTLDRRKVETENCLIIINENNPYASKLGKGMNLQLFPPYMRRNISHKGQQVTCFLNVIKLLFL